MFRFGIKQLILLISLLIVIDQLIKWWVIKYHPSFVFENKGIVFGFIQNEAISYLLLAIGFLILILLILKTRLSFIVYRLSLVLIITGAMSNLIDRIFRGYVVDYFIFFGFNHFNLADVFIIVGVILYLQQTLKHK